MVTTFIFSIIDVFSKIGFARSLKDKKGPTVLKSFQSEHHAEHVVVVVDLPLLRIAVEGSDNPVSLEKPCQASLPPDQQGRHSLGRQPEVQYVA